MTDKPRRPARILVSAIGIVALGAGLGLLANAVHPMGLPLLLREVPSPAVPLWVWRAVRTVDAAEAHKLWREGSATLVDARNSEDFAAAHIAHSLSLPYWGFSAAYPNVAGRLPKEGPTLIYCYGSSCGLSMRLAKRLLYEGYENLIVLDGGIAAWEAAGYPTTTDGHPR
jgi:rhodanese-related sulfurtransferase